MFTDSTCFLKGEPLIKDGTYVLIGCGSSKKETDEPVPAEELYTSNYFDLKKRYAKARSTPEEEVGRPGWTILSAKHGVLWPHIEKEPYNLSIDDLAEQDSPVSPEAYQHTRYPWDEPLYETALDFWTRRVHFGLASWLDFRSGFPEHDPHCRHLEVLAGKDYLEPLWEHDVFEPFPWTTGFPFQENDLSGIGEQMSWLKDEAEFYESIQNEEVEPRQSSISSSEFVDRPDVEGQTSWNDWEQ